MNSEINLKKELAKLLKRLINTVSKWVDSTLKPSAESPYHDLTPLDDLPKDEYMNALEWALGNDKIKNIAITGSYGSGKSSILRSFEKQNSQYKYLRISLASFTTDQKTPLEDFKTGQLIEQSILQQIFYREEAKRFNHSRFKRIIRAKKRDILKRSIPMSLWLLISFGLFFRHYFNSISPFQIPIEAKPWLFYTFLIGSLCLIYWVFDFMRGLSLDKINVLKGDIELSKKVDSSIFNKYLDEIIYFFSNEKYNVVYIEDLDRYENPAIFVKLRELNLLLNEAKEIKLKPVVFIYAVKDDLFDSTDSRTKFFDFIIPVIPVINPSNSKDILLERLKEFHISKSLIRFVSTYVEDMRILHNIINEFMIYYRKLTDFDIIPSKLFSMIVYKNLHPKDFSELHFNQGIVYKTFELKSEVRKRLINEIDEKIANKSSEINVLKNEFTESIDALRWQYIGQLISIIAQHNPIYLYLSNQNILFQDLTRDINFSLLLSSDNIICVSANGNRRISTGLTFKRIEDELSATKSYKERERLILLKSNNEEIKLTNDINVLSDDKKDILSFTLSELIGYRSGNLNLLSEINDNALIKHLLSEGYIDENYHNYISYFYPGSLTRNDEEFRRSVYEGNSKDFDFKLTNCSEIIDSFTLRNFGHSSVLNFHLVNYLLVNPRKDDEELKTIIQNLASQDDVGLDFIIQYFKNDSNQHGIFIKSLCFHWPEFWKFVLDEITPFDRQVKYLDLILSNCDNDSLDDINSSTGYLLNYAIGNMNHFLEYYENSNHLEKIKTAIKHLEVQFIKLDTPSNESQILDFIYENSLYELNPHMIQLMIERVGKKSFVESQIYSSVQESALEYLIEKVESDLNEFVKHNIIIQSSIDEQEIYFLSLLNSELKPDIKEELIQIQQNPIKDISEAPTNLWSTLLLEFKVKPSWDNIGLYYANDDSGVLADELIDYLNEEKVIDQLTQHNFKSNLVESQIMRNLESNIILCDKIEDYSYNKFLSITITKYDDLPIEKLSEEKAILLVHYQILSFTEVNYENLRTAFFPLHAVLIQQDQESFLSLVEKLAIEEQDLLEILYREGVDLSTKSAILKLIDIKNFSISSDLADELIPIIEGASIRFEKSVEISIYEKTSSISLKIRYLKLIIGDFTKPEITKLLQNLPEEYAKMTMKGKRTFLPSTKPVFDLLIELKKMGYISNYWEVGEEVKVISKKGDWLN